MADSYVTALFVVSWTFGGIIITLSIVRIWGRTSVINQAGWDDLFMCLATAFAIGCSALVTVGASYGLGKHLDSIDGPKNKANAIKYTVIAPALSIISSTFGKLSILVFLVRLMGVAAKRWQLIFLWTLCALMVALNVLAIVVTTGYCFPARRMWDSTVPGTCMELKTQLYCGTTQAAYNALMDLLVAAFPPVIIAKLNMNRKMKIGLCGLMGGGVFAAAATIRKVFLMKDLDDHSDITWAWAPITLWYTAEMDVIIIFGTIPALWPIFKVVSRNGRINRRGYEPYDNSLEENPDSSNPFPLSKSRPDRKAGPVTRALKEFDEERTLHTKTDGSESYGRSLTN
ncbi:hypothetical protein F5B20DRAFT_581826 [Whalleya microplaca]|nr:hypothetical protein F5B20DRAFT_581826 [Whalleya microplaca]